MSNILGISTYILSYLSVRWLCERWLWWGWRAGHQAQNARDDSLGMAGQQAASITQSLWGPFHTAAAVHIVYMAGEA